MADPPFHMVRVLIVDDDPVVGAVLSTMVSARGHEATTVTTSTDALEALQQGGHDVVLADVMLKDGTGFDLGRQIQAGGHAVPLVLMSGGIEGTLPESVDEVGAEIGCRAFLAKPFSAKAVHDCITGVVGG